MAKPRKKIDYNNFHKFKEEINNEYENVFDQFESNAKVNGWKDGKSKIYAMMKNYNSYCNDEKIEYEGD